MGYDVGVYHVFGVLLSNAIKRSGGDITLVARAYSALEAEDRGNAMQKITSVALFEAIEAAFTASDIELPEGYELFHTGHQDSRPGRMMTPTEDVVVGFGMARTVPWEGFEMTETFAEQADHWTWAWGSG